MGMYMSFIHSASNFGMDFCANFSARMFLVSCFIVRLLKWIFVNIRFLKTYYTNYNQVNLRKVTATGLCSQTEVMYFVVPCFCLLFTEKMNVSPPFN